MNIKIDKNQKKMRKKKILRAILLLAMLQLLSSCGAFLVGFYEGYTDYPYYYGYPYGGYYGPDGVYHAPNGLEYSPLNPTIPRRVPGILLIEGVYYYPLRGYPGYYYRDRYRGSKYREYYYYTRDGLRPCRRP